MMTLNTIKSFLKRKKPAIYKEVKKVTTDSIKIRLASLRWECKEIPIRRKNPDRMQYKVIAIKGDKSFETTSESLDEAYQTIGKQLGVISNV